MEKQKTKPKEKREELIKVSEPVRQLIHKHLASYARIHDARQYAHLSDAVNILITIIPQERLEKIYGEEFENKKKLLKSFTRLTTQVNHFFTTVKKADYRHSSSFNEDYRNYYSSLAGLPLVYTQVMELFITLLNQTNLKDMPIPTNYLAMASNDVIDFESVDTLQKKEEDKMKKQYGTDIFDPLPEDYTQPQTAEEPTDESYQ